MHGRLIGSVFAAALPLAATGCWMMAGIGEDADTDTVTASETEVEDCGGWPDDTSGLCWQHPPAEEAFTWPEAIQHCDGLVLNGRDDWRLPSVSELRTLIRGCPDTEPGGSCLLEDGCEESIDCAVGACPGCTYKEGPGAAGCYWDADLGEVCGCFWSFTPEDQSDGMACCILFNVGSVALRPSFEKWSVRCVRGPANASP